MPMGLGMDFDLGGGGGGGGGGGAHTSARLKCVWATNVFERQRKSLTMDKIIQFLQLWCNFLWGLRNWLHNKAERGGPYRCGGPCNYTWRVCRTHPRNE